MTDRDDNVLRDADRRAGPVGARPRSPLLVPVVAIGILALGGLTFYGLNAARTAKEQARSEDARLAALLANPATRSAAVELPTSPQLTPVVPVAPPPPAAFVPDAAPAPPPEAQPAPVFDVNRLRAAAVIVDLSQPLIEPETPGVKPGVPVDDKLSPNEQFADRLSRAAPDTVRADKLSALDQVIPQGTIISGVLETAINSDLPGMVRAVVSNDVMSFDASRVLIPRGSRLLGQYRSGVALGQTRAFIVWTRLLRADGVSVQLGSPSIDEIGVAGLSGKVDNHFVRRFGAATVLSVLTAGLDYLGRSEGGTTVVVSSSQQANQLAAVALQREIDIPPTITVAQGTPVGVFVAKDLDFSSIGAPAAAKPPLIPTP